MGCNGNKCCKVEVLALIYAIVNVIVTAALTLAGVGFILYVTTDIAEHSGDKDPSASENDLYTELFYLVIMTVCAIVCLLFSTLLLVGVTQKKPCLLMTYFVFGILVTGLSLGGIVAFEMAYLDAVVGGIALVLCVTYALPLSVVFMTFKNYRSEVTTYNTLS